MITAIRDKYNTGFSKIHFLIFYHRGHREHGDNFLIVSKNIK
jgi:hypothetical protein